MLQNTHIDKSAQDINFSSVRMLSLPKYKRILLRGKHTYQMRNKMICTQK